MRVPSGGVVGYAVLESDWVVYVVASGRKVKCGTDEWGASVWWSHHVMCCFVYLCACRICLCIVALCGVICGWVFSVCACGLCVGALCACSYGGACTIWFMCEVECVPDVVLGGGGDRFGVGC